MHKHYIDEAMRLAGVPCGTVVVPISISNCHNGESPIPPETAFDGILTGETHITASFTDLVREGGLHHIKFPLAEYGSFPSDKGSILLWRVDRLSNVPEGWIWAQPPGFAWRDRDGHLHPRVIATSCRSMDKFNGLFDPWVWVLSVAPRRN